MFIKMYSKNSHCPYIGNANFSDGVFHQYFNNKLQIILTSGETLKVSSRQSVRIKKWNSL